jgi:protein TonB
MRTITTLLSLGLLLMLAAPLAAGDKPYIAVDKQPEAISIEQPTYPEEAKKAGIEATLMVQALVGKDGAVKEAEVAKCDQPGQGFEKAAIDAAMASKFTPASKDGKPVEVWITYKVSFVLQDKEPGDKKKP